MFHQEASVETIKLIKKRSKMYIKLPSFFQVVTFVPQNLHSNTKCKFASDFLSKRFSNLVWAEWWDHNDGKKRNCSFYVNRLCIEVMKNPWLFVLQDHFCCWRWRNLNYNWTVIETKSPATYWWLIKGTNGIVAAITPLPLTKYKFRRFLKPIMTEPVIK